MGHRTRILYENVDVEGELIVVRARNETVLNTVLLSVHICIPGRRTSAVLHEGARIRHAVPSAELEGRGQPYVSIAEVLEVNINPFRRDTHTKLDEVERKDGPVRPVSVPLGEPLRCIMDDTSMFHQKVVLTFSVARFRYYLMSPRTTRKARVDKPSMARKSSDRVEACGDIPSIDTGLEDVRCGSIKVVRSSKGHEVDFRSVEPVSQPKRQHVCHAAS